MIMRVLLLPLLILPIAVSTLHPSLINVPDDQPTIQAGINSASDGDTVLVADGIYHGDGNHDISFLGKAITVMSKHGAETCTLECENQGIGFLFNNGEDSTSVVQGFTILRSYSDGMFCRNASSPRIMNNRILYGWGTGIVCKGASHPLILNNEITHNGLGIQCLDFSDPIITGNTISGSSTWGISISFSSPDISANTVTENAYGGIRVANASNPEITGNLISYNSTPSHGAGINLLASSSVIRGNTISWNNAPSGRGGGVYVEESAGILDDNIIVGNTARDYGGGIGCSGAPSLRICNNLIKSNASFFGGGIYLLSSFDVMMGGNTITGNSADLGGGLFMGYSTVTMWGQTFSGNSASSGAAIFANPNVHATILNSILWGDSAETEEEIYHVPSSEITVQYSDIEHGWEGEGNIQSDPRFVLEEKKDYRLLWVSPCIDAGHADSLDADGTRADMGARSFDKNDYLTLYVTPDTTVVWRGGRLGVTYTLINRWSWPQPFYILTLAILPQGEEGAILGPNLHTLPAECISQIHIYHDVPFSAPIGAYEYWSRIGLPPSILFDEDRFDFTVVE
jgi:parallel beta-helix repeat protein